MHTEAIQHLQQDPVMDQIIADIGPCEFKARKGYFQSLVRTIISQQISWQAANTIRNRVYGVLENKVTPERVLQVSDDELRAAGLSPQKVAYVKDLAQHFYDKRINVRKLKYQSDEEVLQEITAVKGLGVWSAEMFMMFALGRMDVFSVQDIGIQRAIHNEYGLRKRPSARRMLEIARPWRPYRSIAMWYLWRKVD